MEYATTTTAATSNQVDRVNGSEENIIPEIDRKETGSDEQEKDLEGQDQDPQTMVQATSNDSGRQ